jgi:transposase-like protein
MTELRVVDAIRLMAADVVRSMSEASKLRGRCQAGHPVTMENTVRVGKAGYRCKECRRSTALKHWHAKGRYKRYPHLAEAQS